MEQLAQWRAQDCNQLRDCGFATSKGPKLYSHYNGNQKNKHNEQRVALIICISKKLLKAPINEIINSASQGHLKLAD